MNPEIGVLDFSVHRPGQSCLNAVQSTEGLALEAEKLGFARYWIAEHHEGNSSHCSPEIMVGLLASRTSRIRIGAGGVLLRYRDPYFVAQAFSLLSALHPERIDLGIARGRIGGEIKPYFETTDTTDHALDNKCRVVSQLFRSRTGVRMLRPATNPPEIWMLGGNGAATVAARNKSFLCLDRFYQEWPDNAIRNTLTEYEENYASASAPPVPHCAVAIAGICAESDERARHFLADAPRSGFPIGVVKPAIVGSPGRWKDYLSSAIHKWGTHRFMVLVASNDDAVKLETISLVAEAFELADSYSHIASKVI
jgi:luciferase family oxidoreductase group 1